MKISIITTTFNSEATLGSTFESLLSQSYKNYEYIVVDGASTDGTLAMIKAYEPKFEGRMRWISEKDNGLYDAINKGIRMATGDLVGTLHSDDFFTSNDILQTIIDNIDGVDAVYGDVHFVNASNINKCIRYYSSKYFRPWEVRFGYMPAHPSFYTYRAIFEKYGLYSLNYKLASDYEMMVRLLYKYKITTRYVKKDFVTMRAGGLSNRSLPNRLLLTKEDAKACRENGVYSNFLLCSIKYITKVFEFI